MELNELMKIDGSIFADTEFGLLDYIERNGKLYFPASDCAKVLGYHNPRKAIIDHCNDPDKIKAKQAEIGLGQFTNYCLDHPDEAPDLIQKFYSRL